MHPLVRHPVRFVRDHAFTHDHASQYLDGELDEAGSARLEHHARFCAGCRELLATLRRTVAALHALDGPGDADVARAVIARLRAAR